MDTLKGYDPDPVMGNEDAPEYREEQFKLYQSRGWKPEDIRDEKYRMLYAEWLSKNALT